jgi:RNA polymerase-binding transcription factor DksA
MPKSKNDKAAGKSPVKKPAAAEESAPAKNHAGVPVRSGANHGSNRMSVLTPPKEVEIKDPFLKRQKERLLQLRDGMLDSMSGVARDTLRARAEGSEASAFGMHQADAGSDAYDRDFALSLLSQEQDALYEIDEALKRIEQGTYGICELCNKPILHARLEAIPFARYTVDCQSQLEKQRKQTRSRQPVTSLFGLTDEEGGGSENEEEETVSESKE